MIRVIHTFISLNSIISMCEEAVTPFTFSCFEMYNELMLRAVTQ